MTSGPRHADPVGPVDAPLLGYDYAVIRAMPRIDRGEHLNVGILLYCRAAEFLDAAVHVDGDRLRALSPDADPHRVSQALAAIQDVCRGAATGGPAAHAPLRARFGHVTAPRSTVVHTGPVHAGLTRDPAAQLRRLLDRLVV